MKILACLLASAVAAVALTPCPAQAQRERRPHDLPLDPDEVMLELDAGATIDEVHGWAVAEGMASRYRAAQLMRQSRARGALPLVQVRGRYKDASGKQWDEADLLDGRDQDVDWTVDVLLEWDLAEAASGADTWRAAREGRELAELRQGILTQATIAFYDRRRLLAEDMLAADDESLDAKVLRRLRVQELDATLDGLTGGRWSESLPRSRTLRSGPQGRPSTAWESRDPQGEDPDPGLRVPVHAAHRPEDP